MRIRPLLVLLLASACTGSKHSKPPAPEGSLNVTVIDFAGRPISGATVFSTMRGAEVARAVTDSVGVASLPVVNGGEVSAATASEIGTIFGVSVEGGPVEIPLSYFSVPTTQVRVQVTSTSGGVDATVHVGDCTTIQSIGSTYVDDVDEGCLQADGNISISAEILDPVTRNVVEFERLLDVSPDGTYAIALHGTAGSIATDVPFTFDAIPGAPTQTLYEVEATHVGLAIGPYSNGLDEMGATTIAGTLRTFDSGSVSDGVRAFLYSTYDATGTAFAAAVLHQSGFGSVAVDCSMIPPVPVNMNLGVSGRKVKLSITDVSALALDTTVEIAWNDPNGQPHSWSAYAAPPAAAGTRMLEFPVLPDDLSGAASGLSGSASFCVGYNGPAGGGFQGHPETTLLAPLAGDSLGTYSQRCRF